jgi:hypothetical protein
MGQTYLVHWRNWGLPAAGTPENIIGVFWDNLVQQGSNRVYWQHFPDEGIYAVQWSRMRNLHNGQQNCQVLLFDPAVHPTDTGDGLIIFQYQQVQNNDHSRGYATVGLQDGDAGINYTYYNQYAPGGRTLQAGDAIAWVPQRPQVAAAVQVAPGAIDLVLEPGQTAERTLTIDSIGPEGSILSWQVAVRDPGLGKQAAADTRDRTVFVTEPNGGEVWTVGQSRVVSWEASDEVDAVRIQLDRGQGDGFETIIPSVDASVGTWAWSVTGPASATCRARVVDIADPLVYDESNGDFTIASDYTWLTVLPATGSIPAGGTAEVTVTVDAADLEPGTYEAELVVFHSGGEPMVVPLHLLVDMSTATPDLPATVRLAQNAPNPFNPRTSIAFALPRDGWVELTVHDLRGRLVRTLERGSLAAGHHTVVFDGSDDGGRRLASGTYIYRLRTAEELLTKRLTLVK